ncbi:BRO-N domain-containing protein [Pseudorhodoferax soli]|uniref:BRO family protein n=1 Tax=Pseudorhodoferax soli TaxID=545864 RepID=A0A368Y289_9BURK|nr:Bro-N domain-containing protein [Pseudorhodoferax soli]RCW73839.1 BRO family protein [Pseudorhodoferax soli]
MNSITPFKFDGASVRVIDIDGEPHFVGKDVAEALGYGDPTTAIRSHCKGVQKLHPLQTAGGRQDVRVLAEPDVLRLIVASNLPAAERFERWVFEEVLPSIRRTGGYTVPSRTPQLPATVSAMLAINKAISKIPGVNAGIAMSLTLDAIERHTGLPTTGLRLALPGAKVDDAKKLNATQVGEMLNPQKSGRAVNTALQVLELQAKDEREGWILTDAGTKHGEMVPFTRHGHSGYQPLWRESVLAVLQAHYDTSTNVVTLVGAPA